MRTEIEELKRQLDFKQVENDLLIDEKQALANEIDSLKRTIDDKDNEIMILKSNIVNIANSFQRFENGLLNTPQWVKQADLRDTIYKSRHFS